MTDVLSMQLAALPVVQLAPTSRYYAVGTITIDIAGRTIVYFKRRFVPQPERFSVIAEHVVLQGERLDHIAARYFGDPELFWRLCDANRAIRPEELTESPGRRIVITLPEGVSGAVNV